jgi:hypothetical protein
VVPKQRRGVAPDFAEDKIAAEEEAPRFFRSWKTPNAAQTAPATMSSVELLVPSSVNCPLAPAAMPSDPTQPHLRIALVRRSLIAGDDRTFHHEHGDVFVPRANPQGRPGVRTSVFLE